MTRVGKLGRQCGAHPSRAATTDVPLCDPTAQVANIREFSDLLRGKHGIESRSAVIESERVEIIRGKDFARWIKAHPEHITLRIARGEGANRAGKRWLDLPAPPSCRWCDVLIWLRTHTRQRGRLSPDPRREDS